MSDTSSWDFWIEPDGLDAQAGAIGTWGDGLKDLAASLATITVTSESGATVYSNATATCRQIHSGLLQWMAHMQNVITGITTELGSVSTEARTIDMNTLALLDRNDPTEYNDLGSNR